MHAVTHYESPLGPMLIAADEVGLTGAWFQGQKHYARGLAPDARHITTTELEKATRWLDEYFAGKAPEVTMPLHLIGSAFQLEVWEVLRTIPYGQTMTYGQVAAIIADGRGDGRMSAQAVGGAVGRNPLSIIVPCHRVVGSDGSLTGYDGGINRKVALLRLEGIACPGTGDPSRIA